MDAQKRIRQLMEERAVCKAFSITLAQFFTEDGESPITEEQQKLFST